MCTQHHPPSYKKCSEPYAERFHPTKTLRAKTLNEPPSLSALRCPTLSQYAHSLKCPVCLNSKSLYSGSMNGPGPERWSLGLGLLKDEPTRWLGTSSFCACAITTVTR